MQHLKKFNLILTITIHQNSFYLLENLFLLGFQYGKKQWNLNLQTVAESWSDFLTVVSFCVLLGSLNLCYRFFYRKERRFKLN